MSAVCFPSMPCLMPGLAEFGSAPQIGDRDDAACLEERQAARVKHGE